MKKITAILAVLFTFTVSQAQIASGEDGKYYADNNSLYSGSYTENFSDGTIRMKMELKNGVADGNTYIYSEGGNLLETRSYSEGKFNGTWLTYSDSGIKVAEAHYLNNKKDGIWLIWDNSGKLRYQMEYKAGEKTGLWKEWDENGSLIREKNYD